MTNKIHDDITLTTINTTDHIQQPAPPKNKGKDTYLEAGADYVISNIDELKELIKNINSRLSISESQLD